MKQRLFVFLLSIIIIGIAFSCKSTQLKFVKKLPFIISESYIQEWIGGQPGISGTRIVLNVNHLPKSLTPDSIYYQNRKTPIDVKKSREGIYWIGFFNKKSEIRNIQFSNQPEEEYNNKVPLVKKNPFKLKEGEVVLVYSDAKGKHYYRIKNIEKRPVQSFPSPPPKP